MDVRFPFGYGLSYTSFAYSGLTLSRKVLAPGKAIEVLFTVENTGAMAGVETAQVLSLIHISGLCVCPCGYH